MRLYREDAAKHYIREKSDSRVVLIWLVMGRKNQQGFTDVSLQERSTSSKSVRTYENVLVISTSSIHEICNFPFDVVKLCCPDMFAKHRHF